MTMPDLSALDFQPSYGCDGFGKLKCRAPAIYVVRVHLIDHCNRPKLTPDGFRTFMLCNPCSIKTAQTTAALVNELIEGAIEFGDDKAVCGMCDRPITELSDVFSVERLHPA